MNKTTYFVQNLVKLEEKSSHVTFKFNWEGLFRENIGSLGVFFSLFHKHMQSHDKRLFCYLVCLKAVDSETSMRAIMTVIQSCDEYTLHLLHMLLPQEFPILTPLPFPAAKPTPYVQHRVTPAMGSQGPIAKSGAITILPPTQPIKTTYPDAIFPIDDEGLDDDDDTNRIKLG